MIIGTSLEQLPATVVENARRVIPFTYNGLMEFDSSACREPIELKVNELTVPAYLTLIASFLSAYAYLLKAEL